MSRGAVVRRAVLENAALAVAYGLLGTVSLLTVRETGLAAPVWPAAGVALAAVLVLGSRVLPGVVVGSLLVNIPAVVGDARGVAAAIVVPLLIGLGGALQARVGAGLVGRFVGTRPPLVDAESIVRFLLLAGPVACVVAPTVGLTAQLLGGVVPLSSAGIVWLTWWVGDSIGVATFAPITLMLLPQTRDAWHGRRVKVIVPALLMVVGTTWFFLQDASAQMAEQQAQTTRIALEARATLQRNLDRQIETLQGIDGLFTSSEYVTNQEFRSFTKDALDRLDGLQALSWNTSVTDAELVDFTTRMRLEEGYPGFTVNEKSADGSLVPVSDRARHVVVTYIEPLGDNLAAVGFDIASNPVRDAAVEAAIDSGVAQATAPIELVQESGSQKGVLILQPVFRSEVTPATVAERQADLEGFAVGVYRLTDLLNATFSGAEWSAVDLALRDVTDQSEPVLLAERDQPGTHAAGEPVAEPLEVAGRTWELTLQPTVHAAWLRSPTYSVSILVAGLVGNVLLMAFLLLLTGTERQARREAELQGYDARHDPLTDLYNRRAFIDLLEKACQRAEDEASRHVLLYMDLDGFKSVNDTCGHEAGDELLERIAMGLRTHVRDRDVVARIGGDEFAAILNNCPAERGQVIAESLVSVVESQELARFPDAPRVSVSIGLALVDGADPVDVDVLLRRADEACYDAKAAGRGQVRFYTVPAG